MSIKDLMKDYQWNSRTLKRRYKFFDYTSLGLVLVVLLLMKFVEGSGGYIVAILIAIVVAQIYCFKIKGQDKALKSGGKK